MSVKFIRNRDHIFKSSNNNFFTVISL